MKNNTQHGVINNLAIIILLGIIVIVGGVYVLYKKPSIIGVSTPSPTQTVSETPDLTAGWKVYSDEKLDFSINYPNDWTLSPCEESFCTVIKQPRQEKMILKKGSIKIIIDPLGRIGADEVPSSSIKEIITDNISWRKISSYLYYRYQAQKDLGLKEDLTTEGLTPEGKKYTLRGSFKFHLYLDEDLETSKNEEAIQVLDNIVRSLKILIN